MNKEFSEELSRFYRKCRTYRRFAQEEIPSETIREIIDDTRIASCGNNRQTLRFTAVLSDEKVRAMGELVHYAARLPKEIGEPKPDERAAAYIVITAPKDSGRITDIDTGIAAERIAESAMARGIGSCLMLNFNVKETEKLIGLAGDMSAKLVVSLGIPAHESILEEAENADDTAYWLDEDGNFHVPKLATDTVLAII